MSHRLLAQGAASHRVGQPFDRPGDSAIAVYVASDHSATQGRRRALVQIGLQAAPRHAGHRVALRLAIVVDFRGPITHGLIESVRAILESFAAAREPGDRFSLIAAGHDLTLSPDEFRYGAINVALRDLREDGPHRAAIHDLESAVRLAVRTVTVENAPPSIPGTGAVIVVTGQSPGSSIGAVERVAARSAAAGIPVSVVGVGDGYDLVAIDRIMLAGQGNRRVLNGTRDAAALVDRELSASSRVVARTLRLRIRLAPGVKLVDVVGSSRLGTSQTERVRETERRLDRELTRSLKHLSRNQPAAALGTLIEARQFLVGLRAELRALMTDPDLTGDLNMLEAYVGVLDADASESDRGYLSRSMRYAGLLKILPRPTT